MRKFLLLTLAGFLFLGGCTAAQIESSAATIEGDIQAASAAACGIVPTVSSILAVVGALTGTTEITTLASAGISAVEADICSAAPPAASARFRALPRVKFGASTFIGTTAHGVNVTGWRS